MIDMRAIEILTLEETERFRKDGSLEFVAFEAVSQDEPSFDCYLQGRAEELMADVVGIPFNVGDDYGFYRTNLAEVVEMPVPEVKRDEEDYALAA